MWMERNSMCCTFISAWLIVSAADKLNLNHIADKLDKAFKAVILINCDMKIFPLDRKLTHPSHCHGQLCVAQTGGALSKSN